MNSSFSSIHKNEKGFEFWKQEVVQTHVNQTPNSRQIKRVYSGITCWPHKYIFKVQHLGWIKNHMEGCNQSRENTVLNDRTEIKVTIIVYKSLVRCHLNALFTVIGLSRRHYAVNSSRDSPWCLQSWYNFQTGKEYNRQIIPASIKMGKSQFKIKQIKIEK